MKQQLCKSYPLILLSTLCIIPYNNMTGTDLKVGAGFYADISAALGAAISGDTILLEAGQTFTGPNNRGFTFSIDLTFDRYGVGDNPIIDLGNAGRFCTVDSGVTLTINNITIKNGNGLGTGGGAISNCGTLMSVSCTFTNNVSNSVGGAIFSCSTCPATISNCMFYNNFSSGGGAIGNNSHSQTGIFNCTFNGNISTNRGGAISNNSDSQDIISGCTFINNTALNFGGAIYNFDASTADISNCIFNNNHTSFCAGAIGNDDATITVDSCIFNGNNAPNCGGVLRNASSQATITNSIFKGNYTAGNGGVAYHVGGSLTAHCNRFVLNSAGSGSVFFTFNNIDATDNWWGSNSPDAATLFSGNISYIPYIYMRLLYTPVYLPSFIIADFTQNSSGTNIGNCLPNGTPIAFNTSNGIVFPTQSDTIDGQACSYLSATGSTTVCAYDADMPGPIPADQCITVCPLSMNTIQLLKLIYMQVSGITY